MGAKPNGGSDRGSDVIGDMRSVADALVAALEAADNSAAEVIRTARLEPVSGPEELLVLRSALISTRSEWGHTVDDVVVLRHIGTVVVVDEIMTSNGSEDCMACLVWIIVLPSQACASGLTCGSKIKPIPPPDIPPIIQNPQNWGPNVF